MFLGFAIQAQINFPTRIYDKKIGDTIKIIGTHPETPQGITDVYGKEINRHPYFYDRNKIDSVFNANKIDSVQIRNDTIFEPQNKSVFYYLENRYGVVIGQRFVMKKEVEIDYAAGYRLWFAYRYGWINGIPIDTVINHVQFKEILDEIYPPQDTTIIDTTMP